MREFSQLSTDQRTTLFESPEGRKLLCRFRDSRRWPRLALSPFRVPMKEGRTVSELIDGNCAVQWVQKGKSRIYLAFLADPVGRLSVIEASREHSQSKEEAIVFATSALCSDQKLRLISESDIPWYALMHADDDPVSKPFIKIFEYEFQRYLEAHQISTRW